MNTEHTGRVSHEEPLLTVAYLETLPDDDNRYELIAGELFVSPAPGLPHQLVLQRLQLALGNYLETNPIGIIVPGAGAVFSDYDSVIPDLVFVRNEIWKTIVANDRFVAAPNLVIEVLSPGNQNRNRDLGAKRGLYARFGVEEYWIVDRENRSVMIFLLQDQVLEESVVLHESDNLTSPLLPGFFVNVGSLFLLP
ncbi:MAG: Uma2 family endonuclease [Pyrinomonadaceae bacterium]